MNKSEHVNKNIENETKTTSDQVDEIRLTSLAQISRHSNATEIEIQKVQDELDEIQNKINDLKIRGRAETNEDIIQRLAVALNVEREKKKEKIARLKILKLEAESRKNENFNDALRVLKNTVLEKKESLPSGSAQESTISTLAKKSAIIAEQKVTTKKEKALISREKKTKKTENETKNNNITPNDTASLFTFGTSSLNDFTLFDEPRIFSSTVQQPTTKEKSNNKEGAANKRKKQINSHNQQKTGSTHTSGNDVTEDSSTKDEHSITSSTTPAITEEPSSTSTTITGVTDLDETDEEEIGGSISISEEEAFDNEVEEEFDIEKDIIKIKPIKRNIISDVTYHKYFSRIRKHLITCKDEPFGNGFLDEVDIRDFPEYQNMDSEAIENACFEKQIGIYTNTELIESDQKNFCIPKKLHELMYSYQISGVEWIMYLNILNKGGILADQMGLGKTIQIIGALTMFFLTRQMRNALIVVPKSVMSQWIDMCHQWNPFLRVIPLSQKYYEHLKSIFDAEVCVEGPIQECYNNTILEDMLKFSTSNRQLKKVKLKWQTELCNMVFVEMVSLYKYISSTEASPFEILNFLCSGTVFVCTYDFIKGNADVITRLFQKLIDHENEMESNLNSIMDDVKILIPHKDETIVKRMANFRKLRNFCMQMRIPKPTNRIFIREPQLSGSKLLITKSMKKLQEKESGSKILKAVRSSSVNISKNKETFLTTEIKTRTGLDFMILDEIHCIRNPKTQAFSALQSVPAIMKVGLTGTPIQNDFSELWSLLFIVHHGNISDDFGTYSEFGKNFVAPIKKGSLFGATNSERQNAIILIQKLYEKIRPYLLRRMKRDKIVRIELPKKVELLVRIPLSRTQESIYKEQLNQETVIKLKQADMILESEKIERKRLAAKIHSSQHLFPEQKKILQMRFKEKYSNKNGESIISKALERTEKTGGKKLFMTEQAYSEAKLAMFTVLQHICNNLDIYYKKYEKGKKRGNVKNTNENENIDCDDYNGSINQQNTIGDFDDMEKSSKLYWLLQSIKSQIYENRRSCLVFSQRVKMLDCIQTHLRAIFPDMNVLRMDGSTNSETRTRIVNQFCDEKTADIPKVFLLTTGVGGVGLNLQRASIVYIVDPSWNPSIDEQSLERSWRLGQTKNVTVFRLVASGTIEEKKFNRQHFKKSMSDNLLANASVSATMTKSALYNLWEYDQPAHTEKWTKWYEQRTLFDEVPDVQYINVETTKQIDPRHIQDIINNTYPDEPESDGDTIKQMSLESFADCIQNNPEFKNIANDLLRKAGGVRDYQQMERNRYQDKRDAKLKESLYGDAKSKLAALNKQKANGKPQPVFTSSNSKLLPPPPSIENNIETNEGDLGAILDGMLQKSKKAAKNSKENSLTNGLTVIRSTNGQVIMKRRKADEGFESTDADPEKISHELTQRSAQERKPISETDPDRYIPPKQLSVSEFQTINAAKFISCPVAKIDEENTDEISRADAEESINKNNGVDEDNYDYEYSFDKYSGTTIRRKVKKVIKGRRVPIDFNAEFENIRKEVENERQTSAPILTKNPLLSLMKPSMATIAPKSLDATKKKNSSQVAEKKPSNFLTLDSFLLSKRQSSNIIPNNCNEKETSATKSDQSLCNVNLLKITQEQEENENEKMQNKLTNSFIEKPNVIFNPLMQNVSSINEINRMKTTLTEDKDANELLEKILDVLNAVDNVEEGKEEDGKNTLKQDKESVPKSIREIDQLILQNYLAAFRISADKDKINTGDLPFLNDTETGKIARNYGVPYSGIFEIMSLIATEKPNHGWILKKEIWEKIQKKTIK